MTAAREVLSFMDHAERRAEAARKCSRGRKDVERLRLHLRRSGIHEEFVSLLCQAAGRRDRDELLYADWRLGGAVLYR